MKSTLAILLATTAVAGALGLSALAATGRDPGAAAVTATDGAILLAGNDDDHAKASRRDDDDEDCDDDDDDDCRRPAPALAPTGPVAPPANGLFIPGAAPLVRTN